MISTQLTLLLFTHIILFLSFRLQVLTFPLPVLTFSLQTLSILCDYI